ncbi:MAG: rRNA maturation RNase YbeY [Polyangiaceae bacterium]
MTTICRCDAPKAPKLSTKLIVYWAERMLAALDRADAELSVLLTDDRRIEVLNRQYRDKARPTDVLSFHFEPMGAPAPLEAGWLLGDIVISLETAARQAQGRKRPLDEEVRWLLAHGLLHLVGYDHANAEEKRVMVNWTKKLVRAAGDAPSTSATTKKKRVEGQLVATDTKGGTKARATTRSATISGVASAKKRGTKARATTRSATTSRAAGANGRAAKMHAPERISSATKVNRKRRTATSGPSERRKNPGSVARSTRRASPRTTGSKR